MAFAARRIPVKTPHDRYAPNSARISRWCIGESMKNSYLILMTDELGFNLTTFAEKVGLGQPIAGNFWLTGPGEASTSSASASGADRVGTRVGVITGAVIFAAAIVLF
ncbi:ov-16 antigen [Moniliophthora roreri]|uniref:Putative PEBP-like protein n=1 Tax=Moniliophthora roreri TaxID=221103 RepID=A0A0W0EU60_MONRR|nr:ov-16 antigen [Moniliophthora roreri]